jgi:hypothetical protein
VLVLVCFLLSVPSITLCTVSLCYQLQSLFFKLFCRDYAFAQYRLSKTCLFYLFLLDCFLEVSLKKICPISILLYWRVSLRNRDILKNTTLPNNKNANVELDHCTQSIENSHGQISTNRMKSGPSFHL